MQYSLTWKSWRLSIGAAVLALLSAGCGNDDAPRYNVAGDWREEVTFTRDDGTTTKVSDYVRFTGTPSSGEWADSTTCGKFPSQSGKYDVEGTTISFATMKLASDGEVRYHGEIEGETFMHGTVTTPDLISGDWQFTRVTSCIN